MEAHYYVEEPKVGYVEYEIEATARGHKFVFKSASGVFAARKIDRASMLLVRSFNLPKKGKILDLGCGYGFIGIVAAKVCPTCKVILTDINKRAVKLARKNLRLNKIENADVRQGNLYEPVQKETFDVILLNPPMAAGRKIVLEMIKQSLHHLKKGGSLQIVARKNKGGTFLFAQMEKLFSKIDVLAKSGGFWVVKGVK